MSLGSNAPPMIAMTRNSELTSRNGASKLLPFSAANMPLKPDFDIIFSL